MDIRRFSWHDLPDLAPSVLACGFFDGFHKGHQQLLVQARTMADRLHLPWGVLTFDPDPWTIFFPGREVKHIYSLQDRQQIAASLGADVFYILEFTREFAGLSPDQFHEVLAQMHCAYLVCGFDFRYGSKNSGSIRTLQDAPFPVEVVDAVTDQGGKISSTRIEDAVVRGDTLAAAAMLGQYFSIPGTIVHGYKRGGRLLGFPTANLQPEPGIVHPAHGVYAGYCLADDVLWPCMINVGNNPTFGNESDSIEAFLFSYAGSLYGKRVRFFFGQRLRDERTFADADALRSQLEQDAAACRQVLAEDAMKNRTAGYWSFQERK